MRSGENAVFVDFKAMYAWQNRHSCGYVTQSRYTLDCDEMFNVAYSYTFKLYRVVDKMLLL